MKKEQGSVATGCYDPSGPCYCPDLDNWSDGATGHYSDAGHFNWGNYSAHTDYSDWDDHTDNWGDHTDNWGDHTNNWGDHSDTYNDHSDTAHTDQPAAL